MTNRIKALRTERGWSQAEFAAKIGISRQAANGLESGKTDPGLNLAMRVAWLFDRTVEDVFVADQEDKMAVIQASFDYSDRFATAFDEMDICKQMGDEGWELFAYSAGSLKFRRPSDPELRRAWHYQRVDGIMTKTKQLELEKEWTLIGGWMGLFHYWKRLA